MKNKAIAYLGIAIAVVLTLFMLKGTIEDKNGADEKDKTVVSVIEQEKEQEPEKVKENANNKNEKKEKEEKTDKIDKTEKTEKNNKKSKKNIIPAIAISHLSALDSPSPSKPPETKRISFVAVGDIIVHDSVRTDSQELGRLSGKKFDFLPMFSNVADIIKNADLSYINQEAPYGGPERGYKGYPMFNCPDEEFYDLKELGFDIINIANNHMLDSGTGGYKRTIDFLKQQKDITYIGGYENKADYENIRVIEKNGISIALLSYTYGTNGLKLSSGSEMVVPLCGESSDNAEIDRMTKKARSLADIVIVSMHWGSEDHFKPSDLQKKQVDIMVNNGVDVIIGTHPHVLQPMMWKERPDGGRTLVIYSLGNFLSGMLYVRNHVGGIAGFDIVKAGDMAFVNAPYFIPTVSQYNTSFRGFKIYKFSEYTNELLNSHRCQLVSDPGKSLSFMRNIIDNAIPGEFLVEEFYRD